jgi:hypothetical protein
MPARGGGGLLIGVDLVKPRPVLEAAYDDALGVTAAFNLNALRHLDAAIGSDFQPRQWRHVAFYDEAASRIEMHLEAREALVVRWPGGERRFAAGERIHTENSYKYTVEGFASLLRDAGFREPRRGPTRTVVRRLPRGRLSRASPAAPPCRTRRDVAGSAGRRRGSTRGQRCELRAVRDHVADLGLDLDRAQGRRRARTPPLFFATGRFAVASPASCVSCAASARPFAPALARPGRRSPGCSSAPAPTASCSGACRPSRRASPAW